MSSRDSTSNILSSVLCSTYMPAAVLSLGFIPLAAALFSGPLVYSTSTIVFGLAGYGAALAIVVWLVLQHICGRHVFSAKVLKLLAVFAILVVAVHAFITVEEFVTRRKDDWMLALNQLYILRKYTSLRALVVFPVIVLVIWLVPLKRIRVVTRHPLSVAFVVYVLALLAASHSSWIARQTVNTGVLIAIFLPLFIAELILLYGLYREPAVRKLVLPQDLPDTLDAVDRNNRLFLWLFGATAPFMASSASVMLASSMVLAAIYMIFGRLRLRISRSIFPLAAASALFFATMALPTLFNTTDMKTAIEQIIRLLPFLAVFFVVPRLARSPSSTLLPYFCNGAAVGLLIFSSWAIYEYFFITAPGPFGYRISAISGNPVPAAYAAVAFSLVSAVGLDRIPKNVKRLRITATVLGFSTATFTGSLSVLVSIPVLLLLVLLRYQSSIRSWLSREKIRRRRVAVLVVIACIGAGVSLASSPFTKRLTHYISAFSEQSKSGESKSLNIRISLWSAGIDAVSERPFTGYGVQNRYNAILPYLPEVSNGGKYVFTHPHNGFLAAALAGGLPGMAAVIFLLISPLAVVLAANRNPYRKDLLLLSAGIATIYICGGMVGIMFFHDSNDAIFLWIAAVIAAHFGTARNRIDKMA